MERVRLAEELLKIPANMKPSPTMRVRFGNGEVVQMNRRERRRRHIYRATLKVERRPNPPAIFHSLEEMRASALK